MENSTSHTSPQIDASTANDSTSLIAPFSASEEVQQADESPAQEPSPATARIAKEDVILYSFTGVFVVLMGVFFAFVMFQLDARLLDGAEGNVEDIATVVDADTHKSFLAAQVYLSMKRYEHAAASVYSDAARTNVAFLVGVLLSLLGSLIIVRRVRESPIKAGVDAPQLFRFDIATSSPGIFLVFLGTVLMAITILKSDHVAVQDGGITHPPTVISVTPSSNTGATLSEEAKTQAQQAIEDL